jgi:hypothetical protein
MAKGRGHPANARVRPHTVVGLVLPPERPERHPIARLWREVNAHLAWVLAAQLDAGAPRGAAMLRRYATAAIPALTASPSGVHAVHALSSSRYGIIFSPKRQHARLEEA